MTSHLHDPATVLVVDDNSLLKRAAVQIVEDNGYLALSANNAGEAMTILDTHDEVDVLFTDVDMPGSMDGLELAQETSVSYPLVEIVVTSSTEQTADQLPVGAAYLPKPYSSDEVAEALRDKIDPARPFMC